MTQRNDEKYRSRKPTTKTDCTDDEIHKLVDSDVFCIIPWIHIHSFPDGRALPCCVADDRYPIGDAQTDSLKDIWNQKPLRDIRVNMLADTPCKECATCYEQEKTGFFSPRNSANHHLGHNIGLVKDTKDDGTVEDFVMRYYDIRFSNLCNMRCRICGPVHSNQWHKEDVELFKTPIKSNSGLDQVGRHDTDMIDQLWPHIPYLEQVYFAGGEPLIMPEHYIIIDELVKREQFTTRLSYNTNMSIIDYKGHSILEKWKLFTNVYVGASLDGEGARAEYMRKRTQWDKIVRNREKMMSVCPNVSFTVSCTVSIYNILSMTDFHRSWADKGLIRPAQWNCNILQSPDRDRIDVLPDYFKEQAIEKIEEHIEWLRPLDDWHHSVNGYEGVLKFLKQDNYNKDVLGEFIKYNDRLDGSREESFDDTFPELTGLRDYVN